MDWQTALSIFALCIGASFVFRMTGFGFGIFIMTVLPYLMPSYGEATALSGLLALSMSVAVSIRMRKFVSWKRLWPMLLTFAVTSALCICLLKRMDDVLLRRILGVMLILVAIYFAFFSTRIRLRQNMPTQVGAGAISGLMGGFFGMQGPPAVLYFVTSEPDKDHYLAMIQVYLCLGNVIMTLVRAKNGFVTRTVGLDYLYGIVGVAIGGSLGRLAFNHLPNRIFKYVVYGYIGISGLIILITA